MRLVERLVEYVDADAPTCDQCSGSPTVLHECCHCGRSVDGHVELCPDCGSVHIARYEI